jgi:ABC-type spermidine/putrescine transport system permease subunit I
MKRRADFELPHRVGLGGARAFFAVWVVAIILPLVGLLYWSLFPLENFRMAWTPTLQAYQDLLASGRWDVTLRTLRIAAIVTLIEVLLGLPFALWLAKGTKSTAVKVTALGLLTVPFFLSLSARTIVWRAALGLNGPINAGLMQLGLIDQPLDWILFSEFAVVVGMIGPYFPTMVFPLYLAMALIDDEALEASKDLGATPAFTFWHVILPLSLPGLAAGLVFTFIPMIGDPVVANLLGGGHVIVLAASVQSLLQILDYAGAAALSVFMLALMGILIWVLKGILRRVVGAGPTAGALE